MSQSVTIKSNKYGINLVLNPDVAFDDLLKDVVEKFKASSSFFKNAKLALAFEGRALSDDEEQQIIAAIEKKYYNRDFMHCGKRNKAGSNHERAGRGFL